MKFSTQVSARRTLAKAWLSFGFVLLLGCAWPDRAGAQQVTLSGQVELLNREATGRPNDSSGVVVWLMPLTNSRAMDLARASPPQHLRLAQKHKSFVPHILVVQAGVQVEFPNYDPFFHNVFSLFEGKRFDLGLYEAGTSRVVLFDRPGICYLFCNIHPEMSAVVIVLKSPYYGTSDRAGNIAIPNVPPGRYELHVWHERSMPAALNSVTREITVTADTRSFGILQVPEARGLNLAHKNKYGRDYDDPTPSNPVYTRP